MALCEAVYLFLGGAAAAGAGLVVGGGEELVVSGVVGADVLGIGAVVAATMPGGVVVVLADLVVSGDLLRGIPESEVPASD